MIEELKISEDSEEVFDYKAVYNKCLIDLSLDMLEPPTALSIGSHIYKGNTYRNNTFTYGEFSAIVAGSKNKKTFFKSALIAAFIGGEKNNYFPNFKSSRTEECFIVDIDTEQGDYYSQRAFRRVADMVGAVYNNYLPFGVEDLDPHEIILFIDGLFKDPRYKGRIKWLSIDGVADLVLNENCIIESKKVAKQLKKWRKENKCHINTVIHKNSTSLKATGHLGSYIEKKSETVIVLQDTEDYKIRNSPIEVNQSYSRGAPFDTFYFKLNDDTLPYECGLSEEWKP